VDLLVHTDWARVGSRVRDEASKNASSALRWCEQAGIGDGRRRSWAWRARVWPSWWRGSGSI